ncbi:hypothetical protein PF010_g20735 [Phytophthora fragariae]|uniref:Uncharacterized protein n=1 Tax=Phytophthora fragariae TaxID=53985 RepID=A0A6G0KDV5_9STRA|nr:hypothetical protein PF010_g20735 [Phytophthora fragariae]KAE9196220.1 hypothetical protein PF004_g20205 [Phytophthora fragariae]
MSSVASKASVKGKKKRAIPLPDEGETATSGSTIAAKPKEDKSKEKARALLLRCSKEVRTLHDKFELGAYDVNMRPDERPVSPRGNQCRYSYVYLLRFRRLPTPKDAHTSSIT